MRLAVVSDIHGNLTALDAVVADIGQRGIDQVVHGGDVALIGARPAAAIDRLEELGWTGILGNTDELLWRPVELEQQLRAAPKLESLLRMLFERYAPVTLELIGDGRLDRLRGLPERITVGAVAIVHASPQSLWRAPMPDAADEDLQATYGELGSQLVLYGHIHRPFIREAGGLTVANSGSVGLPFDGDPRASYLLLDSGHIEIVRVPYDVYAEVKALRESGYPDAERIAEMLRTGHFVPVSPSA